MTPSVGWITALAGAAFVAGLVDAIAGGGGLITLPVLLAAGLPPHQALGTNKGQSIFGTTAALGRYTFSGHVDRKLSRFTFPLAFAGSLVGAALVLRVSPAFLRPLVVVLLAAAAAFVLLRPSVAPRERVPFWVGPLAALLIGGYDGFFGPGTGTFLIVIFVALLGRTYTAASADAKVVNFASNLAAVLLFALNGVVLWRVALPMAAAQFLGGTAGAHLTVRGGDRVVRGVVLVVVVALICKLAHDLYV